MGQGGVGASSTGSRRPATPEGLRRIPLSTLAPIAAQGGLGPLELDGSVGGPALDDGGPLTVEGRVFRRGLGTAATSLVSYDLAGEARRFSSWVGVDDEVGGAGSVVFRVVADGVLLFDSGTLTGTDPAVFTGKLDVTGVHELQLIVTDGGDGPTSDHADWGRPLLLADPSASPVGDGASLRHLRGAWEPSLSWPVQAIHASLLPSGHILSHASTEADGPGSELPGDPHDSTRVDLAEIATWTHQNADHPTEELYGGGHARLADGSVLTLGGHSGRNGSGLAFGQDQCSRFDPNTSSWIPGPDMDQARWGATALTLGNGDVLALGGVHAGGNAFRPEVYDGCAWRTLGNIDYSTWLDNGDPGSDHTWPFAHLASDGRVFWAGWGEDMAFFDTRGNGTWSNTFQRESAQRTWGSSALHAEDRTLIVGGVDHQGDFGNALRTALVVDFSGTPPVVTPTGSMLFPRADISATVLPDGSVFVDGGGAHHSADENPTLVRIPEIWDPATGQWTVCAIAEHPRGYRSCSLLLPDGRVWTAGGECGAGCASGETAQVYQPPYLFDSAGLARRPVIQTAPSEITFGETFDVTLATAVTAERVTFLRLGSTTHGADFEQRLVELAFSQTGDTLSVDAPANGNAAPPGYYMLFVLDTAGVPSVAATMRIASPAPTTWSSIVTVDGSTPVNRHETAMVAVGGKHYLMGGRGSRPVQEYDPVENRWTTRGFPPLQMHHFQPVVHDGLVWVVGAFVGSYPNETPVPNIYIYDPADDSWSVGPAMPAGRNRGSAAAVVYEGKFYLVGGNTMGHNGGAVPWLDVFDPVAQTWTALANAPVARDHFLAVVVGNKLVAAGGRQTSQPNPFANTIAQVDIYDFGRGLWSVNPHDIPTQRAGTMTVSVGQHAVVIGGESNSQNQAHDETEALDVLTGEWLALPDLHEDRHSGGVSVHDGRIYVAAGSGNQGGSPELASAETLAAAQLLAGTSVSLLPNGGFDSGLLGWTDGGGLALRGAAGVKAPALEVDQGFATRTVPASPNTSYSLRALYRATPGAGNAWLAMQYLNSGGTQIGEDALPLSAVTKLTSATLTRTSPGGTTAIRVRVHADTERVVTIDDVVLLEN